MSPDKLATTSLLVITACVLIIAGFFLLLFIASLFIADQKPVVDRIKRKRVLAFLFILGASIGFAICALAVSGIWWLSARFYAYGSPAGLALLSVTVGLAPLIVSQLAAAVAKALGGSVDASGATNCVFLGQNIGPVIYSVFMLYSWSIFTFGLAIVGLVLSALWLLK